MAPSTFIARILGPVLVVSGVGLLLEGEAFHSMAAEFLHSAPLVYFSGIVTLAVGLAMLNVHSAWTRDWRVLITLFGWLFLVGGILRLLATSWVQTVGSSLISHQRAPAAVAIVVLVIGGFLTMMGYRDTWSRRDEATPVRSNLTKSGATGQPARKRTRRKAVEPPFPSQE